MKRIVSRRLGRVGLATSFGPLVIIALTGSVWCAWAAESSVSAKTWSCETNLTCARQSKVVSRKDFTRETPDLSGWELVDIQAPPTRPVSLASPPRPSHNPTGGMELVRIPGACYRTCSQSSRPPARGDKDAHAQNTICFDSFDIGTHEVTFEEYDRFAHATGRELPDDEGWGRGRRPVINVNVYDAVSFAKWMSRQSGEHYRLPTEVEWEHAARAGSSGAFPWGDDIGSNRANCYGCGSRWDGVSTAPVGSFAPSTWGLYDVVGNVGEWTCSMRDPDPRRSFEQCDSLYQSRRRVYRNGGWSDKPARLDMAFRDWNAAFRRTDDVGFRLVRECNGCRLTASGEEGDVLAGRESAE